MSRTFGKKIKQKVYFFKTYSCFTIIAFFHRYISNSCHKFENNIFKMTPERILILIRDRYRGSVQGGKGVHSPFFYNHLFFCDHFEELQTVLIKVKLIINNALLTYVYPNTIKTYLAINHLLFGRQLLCYSKKTSTVVRNLTVLSSTTDKINRISNHFWHRWKHEYAVNLCETQGASKLNINSPKIMLG